MYLRMPQENAMTWVLFVVTMISGGAVEVEAQRFGSLMECREAAMIVLTTQPQAAAMCEARRWRDA